MRLKERYDGVVAWFSETMPDADTELHFTNPFQLLIAVVLSAQCTDKRVNMVTPALFDKFPTPQAMADASFEEIFPFIKSVSFPNAKTNHIYELAIKIHNDFHDKVPDDMDALQSLPGVGRKTANVVMAVAFGHQTMPVDTHVFRVSDRIGLTTGAKNPLECETQLVNGFPSNILSRAHHWLILHGRYVCMARKPKCDECGITRYCRYFSQKKQ